MQFTRSVQISGMFYTFTVHLKCLFIDDFLEGGRERERESEKRWFVVPLMYPFTG